ncbi:MAG: ComEC/Rec2 family competence protein [Bacillota bacterium]
MVLLLAGQIFSWESIYYFCFFLFLNCKLAETSNLAQLKSLGLILFFHTLRIILKDMHILSDISSIFQHYTVVNIRQYFLDGLMEYYSPERARLVGAIVLGVRERIIAQEQMLHKAGTGHLLALSGMHIGYAALFIFYLTDFLSKIKKVAGVVPLTFVGIYIFIAGGSASLLRAGIMLLVSRIMLQAGLKTSLVNLVGTAGIIIVLLDPDYIYQAGFQISFMVVLSLYYFLPKMNNLPLPLAVSLAAALGSAPWLTWLNHELNLNGLVSNLFLVPLLGPIYLLNFLLLMLLPFFSSLQGLAWLGNSLLSLFLTTAGWLSQLPFIFAVYIPGQSSEILPELFMPLPVLLIYLTIFVLPGFWFKLPVTWLQRRSLLLSCWKLLFTLLAVNLAVNLF